MQIHQLLNNLINKLVDLKDGSFSSGKDGRIHLVSKDEWAYVLQDFFLPLLANLQEVPSLKRYESDLLIFKQDLSSWAFDNNMERLAGLSSGQCYELKYQKVAEMVKVMSLMHFDLPTSKNASEFVKRIFNHERFPKQMMYKKTYSIYSQFANLDRIQQLKLLKIYQFALKEFPLEGDYLDKALSVCCCLSEDTINEIYSEIMFFEKSDLEDKEERERLICHIFLYIRELANLELSNNNLI